MKSLISSSVFQRSRHLLRQVLCCLGLGISTLLAAALALPTAATAAVIITEVAPWSSSSPLGADWFELTNTGASAVTITGWKMDDDSHTFSSGVTLNGVTSIAPGESVIFIELAGSHTASGDVAAFKTLWFGSNPPAGLQIGNYGGSGVGLGAGGDQVNIYNSAGVLQANVVFGASPTGPALPTFDNAAGLNNATVTTFSSPGTNGAFLAAGDANEKGSPGTTQNAPSITGAATTSAFTTTYGTASTAQSFAVSGSGLTANLTATAPAGFQVSSDGTTYGATATFTQSSGSASGTLRIRLAATATVSGSYNGVTVPLTSTGATTVNITTAASGNSVTAKGLTVTANNVTKPFGNALSTVTGSTAFTSSGLVSPETIGSVTITYGSGAASGASAGTYTGSVTPSAATGGTFAASNYALSYVAGDLTVTAAPTINLTGTLSVVSSVYGTASSPTSFSVSGGALTGDLTVTAPAGFEVSSGGGYSSSLSLVQSGGAVSAAISVRLAATTGAGAYSGNVSVSGGGAGTQTIAVPSSTVSPLGLTVTGLTGVSRPYDRTTVASVTGTAILNGVLPADVGHVTLSVGAASFASATVGTAKPITVGVGISGSAIANYTVAAPTGVAADITPLSLTVTGAAVTTKPYDGNTTAAITGTLAGVLSPDVVTLHGTGTFASAAVGTGIAVTSTSTLAGADAGDYSLTQPTGLTGNITATAGVDLSRYVRVGRYDLPEPTRTAHPANSLLCQEASSVTYNWDTDTLFIVGDGGTSVVQVSKTGQLIDSMTLAPGGSPQGTTFYDTEGLTYVGGGQFVMTEERDRALNLFTYVPNGTLTRSAAKTVKLGTTIGNVGLEGVTYDPQTGGFICVKEKDPESVFQTGVDFNAGTATNGSPTATSSTDLFNPALAGTSDFSDVFALSNLPALTGQPDATHLLIISQESGQVINVDRAGTVYSRLTIVADPGSPLSVPDMTMEGVTMDRSGFLYIVNENGGGDADHPQLWVYAPSTATNLAPTAITLTNATTSIPENTSTAAAVKLADIAVTDDGLGVNSLTVSGPDASSFQIIGVALYLKAGTALSSTAKPSYQVTISVDDTSVGNTPDATVNYTLNITAATGGTASLIISEVAPWSSSNSPAFLASDWFEVTNIGTAAANITGWKMDDSGPNIATAVALNGITSIAPGESVIFIENAASKKAAFLALWFGANPPANLQVGNYSGSGVGLSTGGDGVSLFDTTGTIRASVSFGSSPAGPTFSTFDNAAGLNNTTISALAATGVNGAFVAVSDSHEIGSPGTIGASTTPLVTIAALDPNAAEAGGDPGVFRITRTGSTVGALTVNYSVAAGTGQATGADLTTPLAGVVTIPSGQSFVDLSITPVDDTVVEGTETVTLALFDTGNYDVGTPSTATITISDDVQPPALQPGILVTRGGFVLDRLTGGYTQADTLKNTTASPITGPVYLVLDALSANATLTASSGLTTQAAPLNSPYVQLIAPNASLAPGASITAMLKFTNPTRAAISYATRSLAGGNIAP